MTTREAFLARVKTAALQGRPYRVHLQPIPEGTGYLGVSGDLVERFATEVNAVGGQAFVVPDLAAARTTLSQLLQEAGATTALCWQHDLLTRLGLADLLVAPGVKLIDCDHLRTLPPPEQRRLMLACDVGITSCSCAIAETGTLLMCSQPGQERLASLLPPMHIALIERSQILPDLIDAFAYLVQGSKFKVQGSDPTLNLEPGTLNSPPPTLPSNVTLITGPSKTGDIELQLTTGVHGPGKWRVIIIQ